MGFGGIGPEKIGLGRGWASARLVFKFLFFKNLGLGALSPGAIDRQKTVPGRN